MQKFILLFLLLYAGNGVLAQKKAEQIVPAVENALLWRITGNNLQAPSYLFGTIHMIGKEDFLLTEDARKTLSETERVTFEINMDDLSDISSQLSLMMDSFMKGDTTLRDLISEEEYALVNDHFNKMGLPLFLLERIKPMFLSVFASGELGMDGLKSGDVVSYEVELMKLAKDQQKEIGGLETAKFQMSMFDRIPYKIQAEMLLQSIKSEDSGNDQFIEMVKLYKNQDLQGMQRMLQSDSEGISAYEDVLLADRNRNWIPLMSQMMEEKPTFFAVGAGHLGGDLGVVTLLRKQGFVLTPINPSKTVEE